MSVSEQLSSLSRELKELDSKYPWLKMSWIVGEDVAPMFVISGDDEEQKKSNATSRRPAESQGLPFAMDICYSLIERAGNLLPACHVPARHRAILEITNASKRWMTFLLVACRHLSDRNECDVMEPAALPPPNVMRGTFCNFGAVMAAAAERLRTWQIDQESGVSETSAENVRAAKGKGKRVNARMLDAMQTMPESRGWTSAQWAEHLRCSKPSVVATQTWKDLANARMRVTAERMTDRRRKDKGKFA